MIGKFKIETPESFWIGEFIALWSKCFALRCGDNCKNEIKGISNSQSKNINFEEYKICLDGEEIENICSNYVLKSIIHDMYLQEIIKWTLYIFDDQRNYIDNIKNLLWRGACLYMCFSNVIMLDNYVIELALNMIGFMVVCIWNVVGYEFVIWIVLLNGNWIC